MSTKSTILAFEGIHLYEESFDTTRVYMEIECEFEATNNGVTLGIPAAKWEALKKPTTFNPKWFDKTDEDIHLHVETLVLERLDRHANAKNETHAAFLGLAGCGIFGSIDSNKEDQIARGVEHYKKQRQSEIKIIHDIQEYLHAANYKI